MNISSEKSMKKASPLKQREKKQYKIIKG